MHRLSAVAKRLIFGKPLTSRGLSKTLLPKRIALPVFSSDPLSSVAYGPQQMLLSLSVAGISAYAFSGWITTAVVIVLIIVVASYRQTVQAYPSGGGGYQVATVNHGPRWGLVVASALMVDYVLTVAVSVSAALSNIGPLIGVTGQVKVLVAVGLIMFLAIANLRGIRQVGMVFAIPLYSFLFGMFMLITVGFWRAFINRETLTAPSASFELVPTVSGVSGVALIFICLRAFASGGAALTGVEAISNGVPEFRRPKGRNAATTLGIMGVLAVSMFIGLVILGEVSHVRLAEDPVTGLSGAPTGYVQDTLVSQVAAAVFGNFSLGAYFVVIATTLVLALAANSAFNGFPLLGAVLARDWFLPKQLHTRGDRLAFSNGIIWLAIIASALVIGFDADETSLIHLYIMGVFVSFVLSQSGMVRHWNHQLRTRRDSAVRRKIMRARLINAISFGLTAIVLCIVVLTKFVQGVWVSILLMAVLFLTMRGVHRHYTQVGEEVVPPARRPPAPLRNHAVVLVSQVNLPTVRTLSYARAVRPDSLVAVTVNIEDTGTQHVKRAWREHTISIPLLVLDSPFREVTGPVVAFVTAMCAQYPDDIVTVYVPEYVMHRWWQGLLHNQSVTGIKRRLRYEKRVVVASVPWQCNPSS